MKFNEDRNWLEKRAKQEDRGFVSVGGLVSQINPNWQQVGDYSQGIEPTRAAFVRLLQLARRERRLSLEDLAERADVDLAELVGIETNENFRPTPRTVHQLANFLKLPAKKLMVLAGLLQNKDASLQRETVRFAARSQPLEDISPEEHAAFEDYVKFLTEQ